MSSKYVWVELAPEGTFAIRIFKNAKAAAASAAWLVGHVVQVSRVRAVRDIRARVFARDRFACTHCGADVTWHSGQLHERQWRGRGGEVSVENCTTLCYSCHQSDPKGGHGNRKPQWHTRENQN